MASTWSFPTRVVFGAGEAARTGEEAKAVGVTRALVLTDSGVARAGLIERIVSALESSGIPSSTFDGVEANPTESNIDDCVKAFESEKADGVVAVGGGSPIDAAKLVVLRSRSKLPWEELDDAVDGWK